MYDAMDLIRLPEYNKYVTDIQDCMGMIEELKDIRNRFDDDESIIKRIEELAHQIRLDYETLMEKGFSQEVIDFCVYH